MGRLACPKELKTQKSVGPTIKDYNCNFNNTLCFPFLKFLENLNLYNYRRVCIYGFQIRKKTGTYILLLRVANVQNTLKERVPMPTPSPQRPLLLFLA